MSNDVCEIVVYTQSEVAVFEVKVTVDNFEDRVVEALEQGTVIFELAEGGKVILCAINIVAIEIHTK